MCVLDWTTASSWVDRRVGLVFPVKSGQVGIIGGQDVELTLYRRRGYRIVFRTQFLTFRCAFELCRLYSNLLCKTRVVN